MFTITEAEAQSVLPELIRKGEAQARAGRMSANADSKREKRGGAAFRGTLE